MSAEDRQLLEELRSLSQSLESLPRLQLEDDFYQSVLRRAEREMLSSRASPTDGGKPSVDVMIGRAVSEAAEATKPNGEPVVVRRDPLDATSEESLQSAATGRRLPWPRGKRPWIYAGLAVAAGVLVMVLSAPQMEVQNVKLAKNDPVAGNRAEIGNRDRFEAKEGVQVDADRHSDLALKAAFEFRHISWHDEAVFAALKRRNVALCIADSDKMSTPVVATADYTYFRLRDEGYQRADIERWATTIAAQPITGDAFVYFKHEEQGKGPEFAKMLMERGRRVGFASRPVLRKSCRSTCSVARVVNAKSSRVSKPRWRLAVSLRRTIVDGADRLHAAGVERQSAGR